jgi:hypothetical protein
VDVQRNVIALLRVIVQQKSKRAFLCVVELYVTPSSVKILKALPLKRNYALCLLLPYVCHCQ